MDELTCPVASRIGLAPWHLISSFVGVANKFLTTFHIGFALVVPCRNENEPGPSIVPAAKLYPIAGSHPRTYPHNSWIFHKYVKFSFQEISFCVLRIKAWKIQRSATFIFKIQSYLAVKNWRFHLKTRYPLL